MINVVCIFNIYFFIKKFDTLLHKAVDKKVQEEWCAENGMHNVT